MSSEARHSLPFGTLGQKAKIPESNPWEWSKGEERCPFRLWGNTLCSGNFPGLEFWSFEHKRARRSPRAPDQDSDPKPAPALQTPATLQQSTMVSATRSLLCAALLLLATSRQATGRVSPLQCRGGATSGGRSRPQSADLVSSPLGAPVANELRCQCLQTVAGIHFKNIQSLKVMPPGPHCTQTEVM